MEKETCAKCNGEIEGFKCDLCGAESEAHDAEHTCGGDRCMPKCKNCSEAQAKCTCA